MPAFRLSTASGDMYSGVRQLGPVQRVIFEVLRRAEVDELDVARASSIMFSGLRSRCTKLNERGSARPHPRSSATQHRANE